MKKEYWIILIAYIVMQFSSFLGVPLVAYIGTLFGYSLEEMRSLAVAIWLVFSFLITLLIALILLRNEMKESYSVRDRVSPSSAFIWAIGGVFLALFAQTVAANIEHLLGVKMGSENTQRLIGFINTYPIIILVSSVIGPILEEIVFRKILFGALYKRFNFLISALISSVIFALAHGEPEHILLYSSMGLTFAFLYVKTKRIIVPIFAHVAMNTLVVLIQSVYKDQIEKLIQDAEKVQSFIGGFFL